MAQLSMIGLDGSEIPWMRLLIALLRDPDPVVAAVTREALRYLAEMAERTQQSKAAR